ncbi:TrmB family transcriptional regulator [Thermofilum pendens]|uniref:Transcriptional regulator, TrmB n=1 Tax=Thermofilum pendens (strain DSM 2475 / Hrk 5) TaxID=368408 RepID=A1S0H7_THEPD|nr:helix-turn-helix domain-containing protein [Thermofilum pendens]ABL78957.1 transcriptional regulator, TrmB [Thermofilum pendens Hrk 5]
MPGEADRAAMSRVEEVLASLGFSRYEIKAYLALLIRGVATVSEVADLSGISYTKAYDVLSSLENKGLLASVPGRPLRFQALDPETAMRNLLERRRSELLGEIKRLEEKVSEATSELRKLYSPEARSPVFLVRGERALPTLVQEALRSAEATVVCSDASKVFGERDAELLRRRVNVVELGGGEPAALLVEPGRVEVYVKEDVEANSYTVVVNSERLAGLLLRLLEALRGSGGKQ